jgi:hypothetical protein
MRRERSEFNCVATRLAIWASSVVLPPSPPFPPNAEFLPGDFGILLQKLLLVLLLGRLYKRRGKRLGKRDFGFASGTTD